MDTGQLRPQDAPMRPRASAPNRKPTAILEARREERRNRAETRRMELRKALNAAKLSPQEAARRAGLHSANTIYNFLSGNSDSLSYETVLKLSVVLPDIGRIMLPDRFAMRAGIDPTLPPTLASELAAVHDGPTLKLRRPPPERNRSDSRAGVIVRMEARPGRRLPYGKLPVEDQEFVGMPLTKAWARESPFGVAVRHPGDPHYAAGSTLLCVPVVRHLKELQPGRRVIVVSTLMTQRRQSRTEVTVRELVREEGGRMLLVLRSTTGDEVIDLLPNNYSGESWTFDGQQLSIAGLVIGAFQPEGSKA